MNNRELLQKLEICHTWQSEAILELKELIENENKYTSEAIRDTRNKVLQNVILNISEMEILSLELEVE